MYDCFFFSHYFSLKCTVYTVRGCTNEESKKINTKTKYNERREKNTWCIEKASRRNGHMVKTLSVTAYIPHFHFFFVLPYMHICQSHVTTSYTARARILNSKHAEGLCQFTYRMIESFNLIPYGFNRTDRPPSNIQFFLLASFVCFADLHIFAQQLFHFGDDGKNKFKIISRNISFIRHSPNYLQSYIIDYCIAVSVCAYWWWFRAFVWACRWLRCCNRTDVK